MSVRGLGRVLQGVGIAVGLLGLIGGFVLLAVQYRPYSVPTASMVPTVQPGDTILAHPVKPQDIGRGDVVVFRDPLWGNVPEVKRVVGLGGDRVACCDATGRLTVNGVPVTEPYLATGLGSSLGSTKFSATVPAGRLFLLGDNRAVSLDSRTHLGVDDGTVAASGVVGRVEGTVWPLGSARTIQRTAAFDALPGQDATAHGPLALAVAATLGGGALVLLTAAAGTVGGLLTRRRGSRG
ncbi:signal peptidase I [Streptacidiphilus sp. EB129]|uniref:signal peptidase I n=1 Tax=Streptacidiphilus sp. EB129 TaxID=3156262 RepID=UPI003512D0F6